jgi:hypothetical protein
VKEYHDGMYSRTGGLAHVEAIICQHAQKKIRRATL